MQPDPRGAMAGKSRPRLSGFGGVGACELRPLPALLPGRSRTGWPLRNDPLQALRQTVRKDGLQKMRRPTGSPAPGREVRFRTTEQQTGSRRLEGEGRTACLHGSGAQAPLVQVALKQSPRAQCRVAGGCAFAALVGSPAEGRPERQDVIGPGKGVPQRSCGVLGDAGLVDSSACHLRSGQRHQGYKARRQLIFATPPEEEITKHAADSRDARHPRVTNLNFGRMGWHPFGMCLFRPVFRWYHCRLPWAFA